MIVSLTGTILEVTPGSVVLDVNGVGFELGVSNTTAAALPEVGTAGVSLYTRMVMRENAVDLYGFATRDERMLFNKLTNISKVGPKLALSVLSTFTPANLASVVAAQDAKSMARVPGVGQKTASRLLMELSDVFAKDPALRGLAGSSDVSAPVGTSTNAAPSIDGEATEALLAMGFTSQEAELALEGHEEAGAVTIEKVLSYALRRLGKRG